jgi:hypothetical protein
MIALDNPHPFIVQQNYPIYTYPNARFAKYASVIVEEGHLGDWVSSNSINWADINTWRGLARSANIR